MTNFLISIIGLTSGFFGSSIVNKIKFYVEKKKFEKQLAKNFEEYKKILDEISQIPFDLPPRCSTGFKKESDIKKG